jgi:4-amino-4-deoxy-L-arabinose transferase-like glycosyltransferase
MRMSPEHTMTATYAQRSAKRRHVLLILGISLAVKAALFVSIMRYHPGGIWEVDSHDYHQLAVNLVTRGEFSRSSAAPYEAEVMRTPGYPLFLAAIYRVVGIHPLRVIPFQIVLSLATLYVTFRIAEGLFGERAGAWAAGLLAADPVSNLYSQLLMTETLFVFFLTVSVYCFLGTMQGNRWHVGSVLGSLFLALATYTRPMSYYLVLIVLPLILFSYRLSPGGLRKAAQAALIVLAVQLLFIGGWQARNYLQTGSAEYSHIKGAHLLFSRAAGVVAMAEGLSFEDAQNKLAMKYSEALGAELQRRTQVQLGELWEREGTAIIKAHPVLFLWTTMRGGAALLIGPSNLAILFGVNSGEFRSALLRLDFQRFSSGVWLAGVSVLAYGIAFLLVQYTGIVLYVRHRDYREGTLFLALVVVYFLVLSSGPEAYSRFRMPMIPFLCVLSAAGFLRGQGRETNGSGCRVEM